MKYQSNKIFMFNTKKFKLKININFNKKIFKII